MIESYDVNQKAVPVKKEVINYKIAQKLGSNKNFGKSFVKKLKSITEHQIIGEQ